MAMHSIDVSPALPKRFAPVRAVLVALALVALAVAVPAPLEAAEAADPGAALLAQARESLDAGQPEAALELAERILSARPEPPTQRRAAALLVRSTARFMLGDVEAGRRDLERSLALDPTQRQGWLNRAALAVSEARYDEALEAFSRAEALDPGAPDNDLNVGAVLLLRGDLEGATARFSRYLEGPGDTAEGYYLVATNYALAGYAALAVEHLRRAVDLDERIRRRARTDANFAALAENPRFLRILSTDPYEPPPGAYVRDQTFEARYDGGRGPLLSGVLDALQLGERPFDPKVEVTEAWALIWGDLRIKVSDTLGNRGRVQLTAPPGAFTPAEWRRVTTDLLQRIEQQSLRRALAMEEQRKRREKQRGGSEPLRPLPP